MKQEIKLTLTTLITSDLGKSRNFYENVLNQIPTIDSEIHVMYKSGFSLWDKSFAENLIFGKEFTNDLTDNFTHEICFESGNLEEMQKYLEKNKVTIVNPLSVQPWGQKVIRIADPDGRILELGEPLLDTVARIWKETGKDKLLTSQRTHIPLDALEHYLPVEN